MKARHILISTLFLGMTAGAMAQSAPATTGTTSNDPFVQKRQADADAKSEYKDQKKSAKSEYKADKKAAKQQLKEERKQSRAARNEQLANTPATKTDKTP